MSIMTRLLTRRAPTGNDDPVRHVLRRLTFGPTGDQLERFADTSVDEVIQALLDDPPLEVDLPDLANFDDEDFDYSSLTRWWFRIMGRPDAGVHERMVWFWHGLITSSLDKTSHPDMAAQHELLRRHATGSFRSLLKEITVDAAMLLWLNGADSYADAPNENYAREVMELFALGRFSGAYTEDDVKAGAKALAGYWVDEEDLDDAGRSTVKDNEDGDAFLDYPVEFLGTRVQTADEVIDAICDHPQCARYIAGKVYENFFGFLPDEAKTDELADSFRRSDLDIATLVRDVVTDPDLLTDPLGRPRSPVEWALGVERLLGLELETWALEDLGQLPMMPPNVAGWPGTDRWVSAAAILSKSNVIGSYVWESEPLESDDPVAEVIAKAGLETVSASTRSALNSLTEADSDEYGRSVILYMTMALSPEFSLT